MLHSKNLYARGYIKNMTMLTQSQLSQMKFSAQLENVKPFFNSLQSINFDETAAFQISESGMRVIVDNAKSMQAVIYVSTGCFLDYRCPKDEVLTFSLNLNVMSECLGIFSGIECSLTMIYKGEGAPLMLIVKHHGQGDVTTECSIKTKVYEEPLDYVFDEDNQSYNAAIIRGPELAELFNELDKTAEELEIHLSPRSPFFRISTIGVMQSETNIDVSRNSDMMLAFSCKKASTWRYKLSHIKTTMKALLLASKVSIRTDSSGLLGLQLMVHSQGNEQVHIDFFITPLV